MATINNKYNNCPKCQSPNTYTQDGQNACMMCGKRWPLQLILTRKEIPMSKKGNCRNCERESTIVADGLCGMCYGHVHSKYAKGTPEYDQALAEAKKKVAQWESLPEKKSITDLQTKKRGRKPKSPDSLSAKPIEPKNPKTKDILTILQDRRHELMEEVFTINQTISVIEKYKAA
jgi:hypothetical protein